MDLRIRAQEAGELHGLKRYPEAFTAKSKM
jgi:hypothetical protein